MMKLYSSRGTCATAIHIALEWLGQPYDVEHLDFEGLKSPEYMKLNPMGVVPTLMRDGQPLREASANLLQLVDDNRDAGLGPVSGSPDRAEFLYWLTYLGSTLHPYFWPHFVPQRFTTNENGYEATKAASHLLVDKAMTIIDTHLDGKDWMLGDTRTVAEAYLYPMASWCAYLPKQLSDYPNVHALMKRLAADPAVMTVHHAQGTQPKV